MNNFYIQYASRTKFGTSSTEQIKTEINIRLAKLKNILLDNSPLSDTVLSTVITRNNAMSAGTFKDMIFANLPVSDNVLPYLESKLLTMPKGIANQIRALQKNLTSTQTLASISSKIMEQQVWKNLILNTLVSKLAKSNLLPQAISILQQQNTIEANMLLYGLYFNQANYTQAATILNLIPRISTEMADWIDVNSMLLDLYTDSLTLFDLNAAQIVQITDWAYQKPETYAGAISQSILHAIYGTEFPLMAINDNPQSNARLSHNEESFIDSDIKDELPEIDDFYLGSNFPNPFSNLTEIPYSLPADKAAYIKICDINGKVLLRELLTTGINKFTVNTEKWSSGVYYYNIESDNYISGLKKMIIVK